MNDALNNAEFNFHVYLSLDLAEGEFVSFRQCADAECVERVRSTLRNERDRSAGLSEQLESRLEMRDSINNNGRACRC